MSTNELATAPLAPPASVWEYLDSDKNSPLHHLYRLQSMLCALSLSLRSDHLSADAQMDYIRSFAEHAFAESEDISGELEEWLSEMPYFLTSKQS